MALSIEALAHKIVDEIIDDMTDRRGLRHEWDQIHDDIQNEIKENWRGIVVAELTANGA